MDIILMLTEGCHLYTKRQLHINRELWVNVLSDNWHVDFDFYDTYIPAVYILVPVDTWRVTGNFRESND